MLEERMESLESRIAVAGNVWYPYSTADAWSHSGSHGTCLTPQHAIYIYAFTAVSASETLEDYSMQQSMNRDGTGYFQVQNPDANMLMSSYGHAMPPGHATQTFGNGYYKNNETNGFHAVYNPTHSIYCAEQTAASDNVRQTSRKRVPPKYRRRDDFQASKTNGRSDCPN